VVLDRVQPCDQLLARVVDRHHAGARVRPLRADERLACSDDGRGVAGVERPAQSSECRLPIGQRLELLLLALLLLPPSRLTRTAPELPVPLVRVPLAVRSTPFVSAFTTRG
jgi:hypothetical protein